MLPGIQTKLGSAILVYSVISIIGFVILLNHNIHIAEGWDKLFHFIFFFIASFFPFIHLIQVSPHKFHNYLLCIFIFGAVISAFIEKMQDSIPGRSGEFYDWIFNLIGIGCAVIFLYIMNLVYFKKNRET